MHHIFYRLLLFSAVFFPGLLSGQEGHFLLMNYQQELENIHNINVDIAQNNEGEMFFANRHGLVKFDGMVWSHLQTPGSVYAFEHDPATNAFFVGCSNGLGFVERDKYGQEQYVAITGKHYRESGVLQVEVIAEKAYILTQSALYVVDTKTKAIESKWMQSPGLHLTNVFPMGGEVFVATDSSNIYALSGEKLALTAIKIPGNDEVLFSDSFEGKTLLGTAMNKLYLASAGKLTPLLLDQEEYMESSQITGGTFITADRIALATIRGGCIFVDLAAGNKTEILNYQKGLPDDELFSVFTDKASNLWVAHEYGLTQIHLKAPIRNYTHFPGLRGNVQSVAKYEGKLYAATTAGVFYLTEVTDESELQQAIAEDQAYKQAQESKGPTLDSEVQDQVEEYKENVRKIALDIQEAMFKDFKKSKKDVKNTKEASKKAAEAAKSAAKDAAKELNKAKAKAEAEIKESKEELEEASKKSVKKFFWRKNKKGKEDKKEEEAEAETPIIPTPDISENNDAFTPSLMLDSIADVVKRAKNQANYQKPKKNLAVNGDEKIKTSTLKHIFKKVEGIDKKCKQLIVLPGAGGLVVAGNAGLYLIKGGKAENIFSEPVKTAYKSRFFNKMYVSTFHNDFYEFVNAGGKWSYKNLFEGDKVFVSGMEEDQEKSLWISTDSDVHRFLTDGSGNFTEHDIYDIPNDYGDPILVVSTDKGLFFGISSEGLFYFDRGKNKIVPETKTVLEKKVPNRFVKSYAGNLWYNYDRVWTVFGAAKGKSGNIDIFNALPGIKFVYEEDAGGIVWAVTHKNEIYKADTKDKRLLNDDYSVYLAYITDKNGQRHAGSTRSFQQENSPLVFTFTKPSFFGDKKLEYRYIVKGKNYKKDWTEWSERNEVAFSFLPVGKFELIFQAKDALGNTYETESIKFGISPPYWRATWFYAGELAFFALLLFLSYRLNRSVRQYRYLTRGLTFLTLILIVEFVTTILESQFNLNQNPVLGFVLQVSLAVAMFPFEQLLQKLLNAGKAKEA